MAGADLVYAAFEDRSFELPERKWRPVGEGLELGTGVRFAAHSDGPSHIALDTDGDGEFDFELEGLEGAALLTLSRSAPSPAPSASTAYAIHLRSDGRRWLWAAGGALRAQVLEHSLTLIDQDGNGRHDDFGVDAIVVSPSRVASFLSRVIRVGEQLYSLEIEDAPARVRLEPWLGASGRLDLVSGFESSGRLAAAVVRSGELSFELGGAAGARIPVGAYTLVSGRAVRGAESVRIRTGRMPPIVVEENVDWVLEWGGPVVAEFDYAIENERISVAPDVAFFGRAGEEYHRFRPHARSPEILVREASSGRIVQCGRFGGSCGGGFSRFSAAVPADTELEVTLVHSRALFGEIASVVR